MNVFTDPTGEMSNGTMEQSMLHAMINSEAKENDQHL